MILHSEQELMQMREHVEELEDSDEDLSFTQKLTLNYLRIGFGIKNIREIMRKYN